MAPPPLSTVRQYDPQVYCQGSFRLGTAIRPLTDDEEYDVDSVCEFRLLTRQQLSQYALEPCRCDRVAPSHPI
ncbi:cyclic GMP-AMP synthase DncV-like nucleotidyltransferase [Rhizobium sp.]|uniref:cyclic GMP-AMP synthase DncV-like nucleotidyltransferase n=1 Tax=Rhizobium sp. TaxID=391 RepID=UPI0034C6056C